MKFEKPPRNNCIVPGVKEPGWNPKWELLSKYHVMDFIRRYTEKKIGVRIRDLPPHFGIPLDQAKAKIYRLVKQGLVLKKRIIRNHKEISVYALPKSWIEKVREKKADSIFEILPESTLEKLKRMADRNGKSFDFDV